MSNKVPQIRFNGYTDAWVQRKAKDLFIPVNERNREDLPVLSVTQDQGVVFRNDLAIDIKYDESTLSSYKVIHPGDFVISLRSFQGGFELSNVLGISSPAYTIFDFAVPAEQDKLYWKTIFKTFKFIESLKTVTFGIRDGKSISFKEFGDLKLNYPSDVDEQRRIGEFFAKLDETIAANQHKLDLLKEQQKGYLQKMFPKNGAKVPELRFAGFADDWEERKLSDIADRFDNLRVPITASDRKSGDTPYYGANGIQDYVEGFTHDGEFILVAEDGANDLKNYPVQYVNGKVWVNNHAHVLQGKNTITDNKFLMNSIKNFNIEPFLVGGGRAKLNADVMMKLNILLPTFDEQEKIGSFFSLLDDTIALHQRKLELLKEQKNGFLQKMFV